MDQSQVPRLGKAKARVTNLQKRDMWKTGVDHPLNYKATWGKGKYGKQEARVIQDSTTFEISSISSIFFVDWTNLKYQD